MFKSNKELVNYLIKIGVLKTPEIIKAFQEVDRKFFVPPHLEKYAYYDIPLPIGYGATISQPTTVAIMLEALEPKPGHKILEIGAGSGYVCALLSKIVGKNGKVIGIEIVPELAEMAKERLKKLGFDNVEIICADGSDGWPQEAPYDRIIVSAAFPEKPYHLVEQLKEDGIIVSPVGTSHFSQKLIKIVKRGDKIVEKDLGPFAFVPLKGKRGFTMLTSQP